MFYSILIYLFLFGLFLCFKYSPGGEYPNILCSCCSVWAWRKPGIKDSVTKEVRAGIGIKKRKHKLALEILVRWGVFFFGRKSVGIKKSDPASQKLEIGISEIRNRHPKSWESGVTKIWKPEPKNQRISTPVRKSGGGVFWLTLYIYIYIHTHPGVNFLEGGGSLLGAGLVKKWSKSVKKLKKPTKSVKNRENRPPPKKSEIVKTGEKKCQKSENTTTKSL